MCGPSHCIVVDKKTQSRLNGWKLGQLKTNIDSGPCGYVPLILDIVGMCIIYDVVRSSLGGYTQCDLPEGDHLLIIRPAVVLEDVVHFIDLEVNFIIYASI